MNPVSSTNRRRREAGETAESRLRAHRHSGAHSGLAEQAAEIAVQLDCVKLADEELPLGVSYRRFLDLVQRAIPFEYGTLYVTNWDDGGGLVPVAILGSRVDLAESVRFARGNGVSAWVAQERRPVVIPDPEQQTEASIAEGNVRAYLAFPLVQNGIISGVIALARSNQTFSGAEFSRLGRLAESLGAALSRLRREARLRELLYVDAQTGLSNHVHFISRIDEELQRGRPQAEFSVAIIELEGIEAFGRRHDRHEVSELRQRFAERLRNSMRTCDMAASLEDGRFGLVFAGVNEQTAAGIVQRITAQILTDNLTVPKDELTLKLRAGLAPSSAFTGSVDQWVRQIVGRLEYVDQRL